MGDGIALNCPRCDYSDTFLLGVGMMFPAEYQEIVEDVVSGKYGTEWKKLLEEDRGAVVHAGKALYQCPNCHALDTRTNLSIYTSTSGLPAKSYWPYWMESGYTLVKRYEHKCSVCSKTMIQVGDSEEIEQAELPCPKCGAKLEIADRICWD